MARKRSTVCHAVVSSHADSVWRQARLRIWFGGLRIRLMKRMKQESKYQLGLRYERKYGTLTKRTIRPPDLHP